MGFLRFIVAAGYIGGGSVVLAIALFIIAIIEHYRDKNLTSKWLVVCSVLAFAYGAYSAWKDEADKSDAKSDANRTMQKQLDDLTKPGLVLTIDQIGPSDVTLSLPDKGIVSKGAGVMVVASLTNRGAPSIAWDWDMEVVLNDGQHLHPSPQYLDPKPNMSYTDAASGNVLQFGYADALYQKTASVPVQKGSRVTGILTFIAIGIDRSEMEQKGTKFILRCKDVDNNAVEVTQIFRNDSNSKGGLRFTPGMNPFTVKPQE